MKQKIAVLLTVILLLSAYLSTAGSPAESHLPGSGAFAQVEMIDGDYDVGIYC